MPTKAELEKMLEELASGSPPDLSLNEESKQLLATSPTVLPDIWSESKQAIFLHYFRPMMEVQVSKALRGDTASTKLLLDFIQELAQGAREGIEDAAWVTPALELRDLLGVELSAETLIMLLVKGLTSNPALCMEILKSTEVPA